MTFTVLVFFALVRSMLSRSERNVQNGEKRSAVLLVVGCAHCELEAASAPTSEAGRFEVLSWDAALELQVNSPSF